MGFWCAWMRMWMAVRCVGFSAHWKGDDFACIGFAGLPGLWRNRYEKGNGGLVDARAAEFGRGPVRWCRLWFCQVWRHRNKFSNFLACIALSAPDSDCTRAECIDRITHSGVFGASPDRTARSRDEGPVMGLDRRGCGILLRQAANR